MKGRISDQQRLAHIHEAIHEILSYTKNIGFNEFKRNSMIRFATVKQIEIIGEAAKNISESTRQQYPGIAWKEIIGLRNLLTHEYFGIDIQLIWQIIQIDIPELKLNLEKK